MTLNARLSAHLAKATGNETYMAAATSSQRFIESILWNNKHIVLDGVHIDNEHSCQADEPIDAYNSAMAIEGASILLQQGKLEIQQFLYDTVGAATDAAEWLNAEGIIVSTSGAAEVGHPQKGGDSHLIRGLVTVFENVANTQLRTYVKQFLGTQYNAVLDFATSGGSNVYGSSWVGPPSSEFSAENQSLALSILVNAITLTNDTLPDTVSSPTSTSSTGSGTSSSSSSSSSSTTSPSNKAGPIAGGVVGVLAFFALIALSMIYLYPFLQRIQHPEGTNTQRKKRHGQDQSTNPSDTSQVSQKAWRRGNQHQTLGIQGVFPSVEHPMGGENRDNHIPSINQANAPVASSLITAESISISFRNGYQGRRIGSQSQERMRDVPTEELVRVLNQRLQAGPHWDRESEGPPEYSNSQ
ncbi:hypothetical protein K435DRAFT_849126 [Dendrothele bispora CBS 962.96]|uniref:Uncharacterized protein n=1 Tax=Dendrothele bispora (strain CBS 962.96) TaxID=1314807 RepID=A0A4S8MUF8_DENBC|nr:hypothetical protein K435DRAFT_849126 [Dendrothele bispora CBS 962.96]